MERKKGKIFYGWAVTIGCGLILIYGLGFSVSVFSVFLTPLRETFNLSATQTSSLMSVINIGGLITIILSSFMYKKFSIRVVTYACGISITCGYVLYAIAGSVVECYIGSVLIGFGFGAGSLLPASLLIVNWFDKKRGLAMGIATSCTGVSTIVFPPLLTHIINNVSLGSAFLLTAGTSFVLATISFMIIRDRPETIGLRPYGTEKAFEDLNIQNGEIIDEGMTFKEAFKGVDLKLLILGIVIISILIQPITSHIAVFYGAAGYDSMYSAYMISIYGFIMLGSKTLFGIIIDKLGLSKANIYIFIVMAISIVAALSLKIAFMAVLFVIILAMGEACYTTVGLPIITEYIFGKKDMPKILSGVKLLATSTGAVCISLPGFIMDKTGSFTFLYNIYAGCIVAGFFVLQAVILRAKRRREGNEE